MIRPYKITISVWIKPNAIQLDFTGIIDKTHALNSQSGWVLQKAHNDNLAYYFSYYIPEERTFINPYGNEQKITSEQSKWNYLSITKNKNQVVTYLNGVKQQEINYSSENVLQNAKPLVIGALNG